MKAKIKCEACETEFETDLKSICEKVTCPACKSENLIKVDVRVAQVTKYSEYGRCAACKHSTQTASKWEHGVNEYSCEFDEYRTRYDNTICSNGRYEQKEYKWH